MSICEIIKLSIVIIALGISCYTDVKERKIKNFITFPLMMFGLIINIIEFQSIQGAWFSLKGLLFIFLACIIVSILGGFGFGDTKLLMGVAATYGFWFSFDILLFSLLTMVFYFFVFKFKLIKQLFINFKNIINTILYQKTIPKIENNQSAWSVPYACFITLGFLISFLFYVIKGDNLVCIILN